MYIGKLFKNLPKKYYSHKFNNLSLDSRKCKQGDIFFSIRGVKKMEINLLIMRLIMVQKQLYLI